MNSHYQRLNEQIHRIQMDIEYDARKEGALRGIPVDHDAKNIELEAIKNHYQKRITALEEELESLEDSIYVFESRIYDFIDQKLPDSLDEVKELYIQKMPSNHSTELLDAFTITLQSEGVLPRIEHLEEIIETNEKTLTKRRERGSLESIKHLESKIFYYKLELKLLFERKSKLETVASTIYDTDVELYSHAKSLSQEILQVGEFLHAKSYRQELESLQNKLSSKIQKYQTQLDKEVLLSQTNPPLMEPQFGVFKRNNHPFTVSGRELYETLHNLEEKVTETGEVINNLEKLGIVDNPVSNSKKPKIWVRKRARHRKVRRIPIVELNQKTEQRIQKSIGDFHNIRLIPMNDSSKNRLGLNDVITKPVIKRGLPPRPQAKAISSSPHKTEDSMKSMPSLPSLPKISIPVTPPAQSVVPVPPMKLKNSTEAKMKLPPIVPTKPLPQKPATKKPVVPQRPIIPQTANRNSTPQNTNERKNNTNQVPLPNQTTLRTPARSNISQAPSTANVPALRKVPMAPAKPSQQSSKPRNRFNALGIAKPKNR